MGKNIYCLDYSGRWLHCERCSSSLQEDKEIIDYACCSPINVKEFGFNYTKIIFCFLFYLSNNKNDLVCKTSSNVQQLYKTLSFYEHELLIKLVFLLRLVCYALVISDCRLRSASPEKRLYIYICLFSGQRVSTCTSVRAESILITILIWVFTVGKTFSN